jgi:16S rRNA (adenine1518-N6/adenine1519-N6)-dimethyltransferase
MPLYRPSELRAFIDQLGSRAKKSLSQNFLIDGNILDKILEVAHIERGDLVVEIGPGPGALTEALLAKGAEVIAIEKDALFASHLGRLKGNLTIFEADILSFPLEETLKGRKAKVVANLPYQITTPILQKFLPMQSSFSTLTLMVQREFGERLVAKKNTSAYSSITLFAQYYSETKLCFLVKPTSFYPRPSIDSCVVHFKLHEKKPRVPPEQFFSITRRAFQQRRKMLRSSLKELFSYEKIEAALSALGLSPETRPEQLSFEEFELLAQRLYQ